MKQRRHRSFIQTPTSSLALGVSLLAKEQENKNYQRTQLRHTDDLFSEAVAQMVQQCYLRQKDLQESNSQKQLHSLISLYYFGNLVLMVPLVYLQANPSFNFHSIFFTPSFALMFLVSEVLLQVVLLGTVLWKSHSASIKTVVPAAGLLILGVGRVWAGEKEWVLRATQDYLRYWMLYQQIQIHSARAVKTADSREQKRRNSSRAQGMAITYQEALDRTQNSKGVVSIKEAMQNEDIHDYSKLVQMRKAQLIGTATKKQSIINNIGPVKETARQYTQKYLGDTCMDVLWLEEQIGAQVISEVLHQAFQMKDYYSTMNTDPITLQRFGQRVAECYFDNPYHNRAHAADVAQFCYCLLHSFQAAETLCIPPMDQANLMVAAVVHDLEHPGFTNNFLIQIRSQLALTYNDKSPLENHHISLAFQLLQEEQINIYKGVSTEQYSEAREQVIHCVLATDNLYHYQNLQALQARLDAPIHPLEKKDRMMLYAHLIHSADINNLVRPFTVSTKWSLRVLDEFWSQGDREKELNQPMSYLMDRNTTNIASSQIGFAKFFVRPQFMALQKLLPALQLSLDNLDQAEVQWTTYLEAMDPQHVQGDINKAKSILESKMTKQSMEVQNGNNEQVTQQVQEEEESEESVRTNQESRE